MEPLHITSNDLTQLQELGRGACSVVYKYGSDLVIKALNQKGIELHNENEFTNLLGIDNPTCVFPKNRVEIDGNFQGYTMDYIDGVPLHEVIKQIDIPTLIEVIKEVEVDLKQLSTEKVLFQDLNQGGIMWDKTTSRMKIIDTDFFEKNERIEPEQCYSANITSFNSMLEMELGIINGQGTKMSEYLHTDPEFSQLYTKYMIYSLNGRNISVTELVSKAVEVFEKNFGVKVNSFEEMQVLIGERVENKESSQQEEIPIFEPPQQDIPSSALGLKQKIANFLADKKLLRKVPFIDKFIAREQRLLNEGMQQENIKSEETAHDKFVNIISENGKHRNSYLGRPVKSIEIESVIPKIKEENSMSDSKKIEQMKKKMDVKSMEDDL